MTKPRSSLLTYCGVFPPLREYSEYPCWGALSQKFQIKFDRQHRADSYNLYKTYWLETTGERNCNRDEIRMQYERFDAALFELVSSYKECHAIARSSIKRCISSAVGDFSRNNCLESNQINMSNFDIYFSKLIGDLRFSLKSHSLLPCDAPGRANHPRDELVQKIFELLRSLDQDAFGQSNKATAYYIIETFSYLDEASDSGSKTQQYKSMDAAKHRQDEDSLIAVAEWVKSVRRRMNAPDQGKF